MASLDEAMGALSQVVKINPENLNGLTNLAIAQAQAEDYEGCRGQLSQGYRAEPRRFQAPLQFGQPLLATEKNTLRQSGPMNRQSSS